MRKRTLLILAIVVLAALVSYKLTHQSAASPTSSNTSTTPKATPLTKPAPPTFDKSKYSLTTASSLWVIVNKHNQLNPKDYAPADLTVPNVPERVAGTQVSQKMAPSLEAMFAAAKTDGAPMKISSGYRSYTYQVNLYNGYVKTEGQTQADAESARPGYSEHQTGLAADLASLDGNCGVEQCWANTAAGKWLAANAYKYGFIIRYPDGQTAVTGYEYEPWHVRYVGVALATEMHKQGITTLEQFFGLPAAPDYQ